MRCMVSLPEHDSPNDIRINVGKIAFESAKQSIISKQHPITWNKITRTKISCLRTWQTELIARLTIFWFQLQIYKSILEVECVHVQLLLLMVARNNTMKLVLLLKQPFFFQEELITRELNVRAELREREREREIPELTYTHASFRK